MSNFDDIFPDDEIVNSVIGDDITFKPIIGSPQNLRGFFNEEVEIIGDNGYVTESQQTIELLSKDLLVMPKRKDILSYAGNDYEITEILDDDGAYTKFVVI